MFVASPTTGPALCTCSSKWLPAPTPFPPTAGPLIHNNIYTIVHVGTSRAIARCASGCATTDIAYLFPTALPIPTPATAKWKAAVVNGVPLRVTLQVGASVFHCDAAELHARRQRPEHFEVECDTSSSLP